MPELTFPYKSRPLVMLGLILIGGICAAAFFYMALYDAGLELRFLGLYAAGQEAVALAWFFAIFMSGLAVFGVWALLRSLRAPKSVVLTATSLIAPKAPISKVMMTLPYGTISRLSREDVMGQVFLHVHHADSKLSIPASYLADKSAFDVIHRELQTRRDAATGVTVI